MFGVQCSSPLLFQTKLMSTEVKPPYSPGLAGVVAGETEICWVDPNAGLMYRGYDIHEMAKKARLSICEMCWIRQAADEPNAKAMAATAAPAGCHPLS